MQTLQLLGFVFVGDGPILKLLQLVLKTLAHAMKFLEDLVQRPYLLRVGLQDGAQEDIEVVEGGLRLLYPPHLLILFQRHIDLLGFELTLLVSLDGHIGPASDWQQKPEVTRLACLLVLILQLRQLCLQQLIIFYKLLVAHGDLLVRRLDHLLAEVGLGQHGRVQGVAHVEGVDEDA